MFSFMLFRISEAYVVKDICLCVSLKFSVLALIFVVFISLGIPQVTAVASYRMTTLQYIADVRNPIH